MRISEERGVDYAGFRQRFILILIIRFGSEGLTNLRFCSGGRDVTSVPAMSAIVGSNLPITTTARFRCSLVHLAVEVYSSRRHSVS